ncbi:hypothetical protein L6164_025792 [Bauhinia variegata]|uniref:Uncharacterized protein n=1 Tax=Bauhinia variegata TaxID=167791 RepID=A0ACB9M357_BAUVA|nr:hypothetical protein L6164_025792 [Bauhinia variegata]
MNFLTKAVVLLLLLTLMHVQPNQAGRLLSKEKQLKLESLDKGPVPPSGPSTCTYVPAPAAQTVLSTECMPPGMLCATTTTVELPILV